MREDEYRAKRFHLVDADTGEIVAKDVVLMGRELRPIDNGFAKLFILFLVDLILDDKVIGKAARLLFYMAMEAGFSDLRVYLDPQEAAEFLGVDVRTIYRWLRVLESRGYVRYLKPRLYVLKPYTVVKGNMQKALTKEEVRQRLKRQGNRKKRMSWAKA